MKRFLRLQPSSAKAGAIMDKLTVSGILELAGVLSAGGGPALGPSAPQGEGAL
jgi:hypothetical protein